MDTKIQQVKFSSSFFLILFLLFLSSCESRAKKNTEAIVLPENTINKIVESFEQKKSIWRSYEGSWVWNLGHLMQTATDRSFPLVLRKKEQFSSLDVSVKFQPISGRIDASGGVVFRAKDAQNYYIVRANALEDNFRLYTFKDGYRSQIATARVTAPALGLWHTIRVVAVGDHIQAYLDGTLYIDHHDDSYTKGYIGLWTKEDSVTAFDDMSIRGE